jgi:hypothetical protein
MKQVYLPYWKWECYQNGMWNRLHKNTESEMLKIAIEFTGNHLKYGAAMAEVINAWPNSMLNFLTNTSINKLAYIGHAAVYYKLQIPEHIVRSAWRELSESQQNLANLQALKALKQWQTKQEKGFTSMSNNGKIDAIKMEYQMMLQFP